MSSSSELEPVCRTSGSDFVVELTSGWLLLSPMLWLLPLGCD